MILTCPACQTRYEVDAAKFPPMGRDVRCARCGEVWHAMGLELASTPAAPPPPPPSFDPEPPEPEVYAHPEPRDPEPQSEETSYDEPAEPKTAAPAWSHKLILTAGWAALALLVVIVAIVGSVFRQQVVEAWPKSATLYSKLGLKVETAGLDIRNIHYSEAPQDGQLVLTVTGALTNVTNRELPVPQIRVGLVDGDKRELYHWTFAPDVMTLRPGQTTRFVTRLSNPPEKAARAEVRFAKAGE